MTFELSQIVLLVCIAVVSWQIVGALRSGRVSATRTVQIARDQQSLKFWSVLTFQVATIVGLVWLTSRPLATKPSSEAAQIYAVTAAVREEIPAGRSAAFRNVRADAKSGFVCGEFTLESSQRRFVGDVTAEKTRVVIEQRNHQNFAASFARLCGGKWVLPPAR